MILRGGRVVTPSGVLEAGWVDVAGGRIAYVGTGTAPDRIDSVELAGSWLLPGFVDLHVHGGGGADVTRSADDMAHAIAFHRRHGTTTTLVSLMAQPVPLLVDQLDWAASFADDGAIAGVHLEGPFLSPARCGAQRPESLLTPSRDALTALLGAGRGHVRTMTIAPELPGAIELIHALVDDEVVAAVGHTNASYDRTLAGFEAGATLATHLFNAMGSFDQRAPGPAFAALDAGVTVELIDDGVHVHDALIRLATRVSPVALVTDAISATGVGDGEYSLGEQRVVVRDGRAHLAGTDSLAGSTLTMDSAVRRAVLDVGLSIEAAAAAAATTPARVLGRADRTGAIAAGLDADLVVLDDDLRVERVMRRGVWV